MVVCPPSQSAMFLFPWNSYGIWLTGWKFRFGTWTKLFKVMVRHNRLQDSATQAYYVSIAADISRIGGVSGTENTSNSLKTVEMAETSIRAQIKYRTFYNVIWMTVELLHLGHRRLLQKKSDKQKLAFYRWWLKSGLTQLMKRSANTADGAACFNDACWCLYPVVKSFFMLLLCMCLR